MVDCADCKYRENMLKWPCYDCEKGDKWEEFSYTNADRIRAMTDEELAEWCVIFAQCPDGCNICSGIVNTWKCKKCWLDWLKQEAKND